MINPKQNNQTVDDEGIPNVTWNDICNCGKRFGDHNNQDLHDCKLTGDENQEGLRTLRRER